MLRHGPCEFPRSVACGDALRLGGSPVVGGAGGNALVSQRNDKGDCRKRHNADNDGDKW